MEIGHFYYITDQYFIDFPDDYSMKNKEADENGEAHDRPCFYAFKDTETGLYWMIPFSSQVGKYKKIYNKKIGKYGRCDTIVFGNVLGHTKAFLIQNICPILPEYVKNEYYDKIANIPVRVSGDFEKRLKEKAERVLNLQRHGKKLIFTNVLEIESKLLDRLDKENISENDSKSKTQQTLEIDQSPESTEQTASEPTNTVETVAEMVVIEEEITVKPTTDPAQTPHQEGAATSEQLSSGQD